jgi:hypothetical protein
MDRIRSFTRDDVPTVAALFQKIFRRGSAQVPKSLETYLARLYFDNPWYDGTLSSLVYEESGHIGGFVGALPMPFLVGGKRIMAVVAGNLMMEAEQRNPFAAVRMLRQLFAGPQDATLTDTATDKARKIWEGLGSATIPTYSLQWLRVLRPSRFVISAWTGKKIGLSPLAILARPITTGLDWASGQLPKSPMRLEKSELVGRELSPETLLQGIREFSRKQQLVPDYSIQSLQWLLAEASQKKEYGPLRRVALFDKTGTLAGWYMYYPNTGKTGQVLQCVGKPSTISEVLAHLFEDALQMGSLALIGRFDPKMAKELSEKLCIIVQRGSYVQAFSKHPLVVEALYAGNAFFTRMEGEWWTRLQGDTF